MHCRADHVTQATATTPPQVSMPFCMMYWIGWGSASASVQVITAAAAGAQYRMGWVAVVATEAPLHAPKCTALRDTPHSLLHPGAWRAS